MFCSYLPALSYIMRPTRWSLHLRIFWNLSSILKCQVSRIIFEYCVNNVLSKMYLWGNILWMICVCFCMYCCNILWVVAKCVNHPGRVLCDYRALRWIYCFFGFNGGQGGCAEFGTPPPCTSSIHIWDRLESIWDYAVSSRCIFGSTWGAKRDTCKYQ